MRKIFAIAATLAVSSAATLTAAPSQAVTVAAPNALAATASQTQPGLEKAAVFCRWTRWGRRCTWGGPAFAWGGGPVWGWAAALGLAAARLGLGSARLGLASSLVSIATRPMFRRTGCRFAAKSMRQSMNPRAHPDDIGTECAVGSRAGERQAARRR